MGRRFRLPKNSSLLTSLPSTPIRNTRVVSRIAATTSNSTRTPSTTHTANSLAASPSGNPIINDGYTLSKVYGSTLQNPNTLKAYACTSCTTTFQRDSTMYPDPSSPTSSPRFLCCDCFIASSSVKADCVECRKPMYKLKKERDFVENGGPVWHGKCFECERCSRNTTRNKTVHLMGRPCCAEYFNTSLLKPETTHQDIKNMCDGLQVHVSKQSYSSFFHIATYSAVDHCARERVKAMWWLLQRPWPPHRKRKEK